MENVICDKPKSKGGINYIDLIQLAESKNIVLPEKILKRDLCVLVNDKTAFKKTLTETVRSKKYQDSQIDFKSQSEDLPYLSSLYKIEQVLGEGSFGKVLRATDKKTGEEVALKLLHSLTDSSKREVAILINVSKIYRNGCSKNILCYKDQFAALYDEKDVKRRFEVIVTQFIAGKSLDKKIEEEGPFTVSVVSKWAQQLFAAIKLCHSYGISHMDIKPANLMIRNDNSDLVIIDFGISCNENSSSSQVENCKNAGGGTLVYMSPDYINSCYLSNKKAKYCDRDIREKTDTYAAALSMLDALTNNKYVTNIVKLAEKNSSFENNIEKSNIYVKQLIDYIEKSLPSTGARELDTILTYNLNQGYLSSK